MKVLITRKMPQAGINVLHIYSDKLELDYRLGLPLTHASLKKSVSGVDALIPDAHDRITKDIIDSAGKNLKVIATNSIGYDHIDLEYATKKGIYVGNTPGNLTEAIAEHAMALILDITRNVSYGDRYCRLGEYKYADPMKFMGSKVGKKTLGIIGLGRIGQHLAKIAKNGFNMEILYTDIVRHPEAEDLLDAKKVTLEQLLENSDYVSICANLTEQTHHLLGEEQFKKMKPLAYLINTARGPIVNELALVNALQQGWIAGAALDVFEEEPKIHPDLLQLDNVVLTPHIASATWEARIQMARMTAENVIDVLINNKPPRYLVNKDLVENSITSLS